MFLNMSELLCFAMLCLYITMAVNGTPKNILEVWNVNRLESCKLIPIYAFMSLFAGIVPHKKAQHHRKESESGYMGESHMCVCDCSICVEVDFE